MGLLALPLLVLLTTRVLLIANPASRRGARLIGRAVAAVKRSGASIEVETTERSGHAAEIAAARGGQFDIVLTLGGDGTAMEVAGALAWTETP
ncbi:MAG TPA: diacylglycerol kinase family protein, partial [Gemmatimonadaceae bacterium]|nr:diacylglycerol kinase family protein [Gemmatimonadaceae bacterium]